MFLPPEVADLVNQCQNSLAHDARGSLLLKLRHRLLLAFGPYQSAQALAVPSVGYYRRFALACATAEKVLPLWEGRFPDDHRPRQLLALAKSYARGEATREELEKQYTELEARITAMTDEEGGSEQYAGLTAVKVSYVALIDECFSEFDSDDEDEDLDVWSWSPAYTASVAYAGVASSPPELDINRRREFWQWWLGEAVPEAYQHKTAIAD